MPITKLHINTKTPDDDLKTDIIEDKYQYIWETRSSIRTRPRKTIDFTQKGYFFPESKQPLLLDANIINLGEKIKEKILLQSFRKYLNDIITLEIALINDACNKIIYKDLIIKYPQEIKFNAYTIIIDEYYHVYIAQDMLSQINKKFSNIENFDYPISDSYHAVSTIKSKLHKKYHDMFEILAVCIFETTLVRELIDFFNTKTIHPSIKYYINDHMNDESRHYNYFYDLLCYTWKNLPSDYQDSIGKHFAEFICLYLNIESDKKFFTELANSILQNKKLASEIVQKLYKGFSITPEIPIVKNVINVLLKSNIINNNAVRNSFNQIGWSLDGTSS